MMNFLGVRIFFLIFANEIDGLQFTVYSLPFTVYRQRSKVKGENYYI